MSGTSTLIAKQPKASDVLAADAAAAKLALEAGNKLEAARKAALEAMDALGAGWAEKQASLTQAAWRFAEDVAAKTFTADDARDVYMAVAGGYNRVADASAHGIDRLKMDEATLSSQVSTFATFATIGAVHCGLDLYKRVVVLRPKVTAENRASAYNMMAKCNRETSAAVAKLVEARDVAAKLADEAARIVAVAEAEAALAAYKPSDDELVAWMTPGEGKAKSDLAKFDAWLAAGQKLVKSEKYPGLDGEVFSLEKFRIAYIEATKAPATTTLEKGGAVAK